MVIRPRWGNMTSGFLGEDLCKFGELFVEDNSRFSLFCSGSEFCGSGESGHHWGSQDNTGVSLDDPMESSISFCLGNELVFNFVM